MMQPIAWPKCTSRLPTAGALSVGELGQITILSMMQPMAGPNRTCRTWIRLVLSIAALYHTSEVGFWTNKATDEQVEPRATPLGGLRKNWGER